MNIRDPQTGIGVRVNDEGALKAYGALLNLNDKAVTDGRAYFIQTGLVAFTGTGSSSLLYVFNGETSPLLITKLFLEVGTKSATTTDDTAFTLLDNPTGGDIISDATAVGVKANRSLGHSSSLASTTLAYKGKDGGTITGGTTVGIFYAPDNSSRVIDVNLVLPIGRAFGISLDLNTSGGANANAGIEFHKVDADLEY